MVGSSRIWASVIVVATSELVTLMRGISATTLTFSFVPATSIFRSTLTAPPTVTVTFALAVLNPRQRRGDLVGARGQVSEHVLTSAVGGQFARSAGADGFRRDGYAGQDPAGGVGDDAR